MSQHQSTVEIQSIERNSSQKSLGSLVGQSKSAEIDPRRVEKQVLRPQPPLEGHRANYKVAKAMDVEPQADQLR